MKLCTECMNQAAKETLEFLGEIWADVKKALPTAQLVEFFFGAFGAVSFFCIMLLPVLTTYEIMSPDTPSFLTGLTIFVVSLAASLIYGVWFICLCECRKMKKWEAENTINMDKTL